MPRTAFCAVCQGVTLFRVYRPRLGVAGSNLGSAEWHLGVAGTGLGMLGSVSGPPEPVSGSLERRLGRRNDSPDRRNKSRSRRNDARRGVNAARVRANEQWEAVSFRYRFCETVLASCKRCRSHCLLRENLPDVIDDLCIRSRSWSAPFFCLPGHRGTIASWRTLSGCAGDPARTAIPESALHWPKSAGGYASDGVTPLSSMEFFCFPAPTPTATATATPTATLTPRATPAPRVRPTPAPRP